MNCLKSLMSLFLLIMFLTSCSSNLKVNEFSTNANPQVELQRIDENINQAQSRQVNVLSPKYFEAAKSSRDKAVELRGKNKSQKDVLHRIAVAQANLDKANSVAEVANVMIKGPIEARQGALNAKAHELYPKDLEIADNDFKKLTEQIEDNDSANVERRRGKIEEAYRSLELKSLKKNKLGYAKDTIQEAVKEGAQKLTPDTLSVTNKKYSESEAIIENQRHDAPAIAKASEEATAAANRLLKMVRDAKGSSTKKPEELAKQIEENELKELKAKEELKKSELELAESEGKLVQTSTEKNQLESQVSLDNKFEKARKEFNNNEAEVYKQGDKLLLRLKGLSFEKNNAEIKSDSFSILSKVQKVIGDIGASQITIEGHTDSMGGKKLNDDLSVKRAESVLSYLIANNAVTAEKTSATGYGDSKPIATNKTAEGRAQNRRVDIVITSEEKK